MTRFHITAHDVPGARAVLRSLQPDARRVAVLYPGLTGFRFELRPSGREFEAHVELRLPQHQVIFNAAAATAEAAARQALARVAPELARLEARDAALAVPAQAEAA